jgi:ribosomal protein S18 acetylase RimI-like enzyme
MLVVSAADASLREVALRLLFARFPVEEQPVRLRDTLASVEQGRLSLEGLLLATLSVTPATEDDIHESASGPSARDPLPVGAALVMFQSDGVALVWPPVVSCGAADETAVEDALMTELCRRIDVGQARLAQALLSPDDVVEARLLTRHGFRHGADLFFLARTLQRDDANAPVFQLPTDAPQHFDALATETFAPHNADRFASVLEQSYRNSLDCPDLKDFRSGAEAIQSHQLSGVFNPNTWTLFTIDGHDAGVILLNDHPDQNAVELVYMGVTPELRGKGLGREMLRRGLLHSIERERSAMFLAVDCQNRYANAVYAEFSFAELARRRVLLRQPAASSRE